MPDKIYKLILRLPMWGWLLIFVTISEILTFLFSYLVGHLLWGQLPEEVFIVGVVDSFLVSLVISGVLLVFVSVIKQLYQNLQVKNDELSDALLEVKTLQGIMPICSYCKKVRNDKGYYEQIEEYLARHSDVDFSHTICPTCMKEHYDIEE